MEGLVNKRPGRSTDNREEKPHWEEDMKRASKRIVRLNAEDVTFARVPVSTLTQEIERHGGVSNQNMAAFYAAVAASLVVRVNRRYSKHKLDL